MAISNHDGPEAPGETTGPVAAERDAASAEATALRSGSARVDWRGVGVFLLIAYGGAWLVTTPLWVSDLGLDSPSAMPLLIAMMWTPAVATFVVTRWVRRPENIPVATGLRPSRRLRVQLGYGALAWFGFPLLWLGALALGGAAGVYQADLREFSGFREMAEIGTTLPDGVPIVALALTQVLWGVALAPVFNAIPTFGEEWGWRGYLLPQLLPLGQWPALLLSGAIWGLWHAPIILLGYNYPEHRILALPLMILSTIVMGVLVGWLRLASGSIWPAVIAHAAINGSAGLSYVFVQAGAGVDTAQTTLLGWTGWIVMLVVIALLVTLRRLPVRRPAT
jgi:uncharacterized protein